MNGYTTGDLFLIYGFLAFLMLIGILFLLQSWFYRIGFYKTYTLHATAKVKGHMGSRLKTPIYSYETRLDGERVILTEQSSIGVPFYSPEDGDVVDVYIHPDPDKIVSLSFPPNTKSRCFVCEKRAHAIAKFDFGFGLSFFLGGLFGIIMFTIG